MASQPLWLSQMCVPTSDQEVAGLIPARYGNILSDPEILFMVIVAFPLIQEG